MSYEIARQELLFFRFEVETSEFVLTGAEPKYCHVKRVGAREGVPVEGAPAMMLTGAWTPPAPPALGYFTFTGDSSVLAPGKYMGDAWVVIGTRKVLLFKFNLLVDFNATVIS